MGYDKDKVMSIPLTKEKYILYILNHLPPEKSDKFYLNKIAFLIEFAYLYFHEKPLSSADYAAITYGPVINDYKLTLDEMQKKKLIKVEGNNIRVLTTEPVKVSEEISTFSIPLIQKYSNLSMGELTAITHKTDSYKISTHGGVAMGADIDKSLAALETFFDESINSEAEIPESSLPSFDRKNLVKYDFGRRV